MGKQVGRKKKKGRPSLLDLQKRSLREQQLQQQQEEQAARQQQLKRNNSSAPHSNPNYKNATPVRRSTRRNPVRGSLLSEDVHEDTDDVNELSAKRREEKHKRVVGPHSQKSSLNYGATLDDYGSDTIGENDNAESYNKKRKINAIRDGSGTGHSEKGEKSISRTNPTNILQDADTRLDLGPSTPLPDKKLLLFILDRLQKKDTYGVFSEPVDPEELPDYHEIVDHPMDFSTVRKKLVGEVYANLEEFEDDVFLICSNAMQYNPPDTIYFRQARNIQELAKKNFENLRQDSDDNETEPIAEPKVVRRGRPPTKNLKKPLGRPPSENTVPDFSSGASLATAVENTDLSNHNLRRGPQIDKSGIADSGRFPGSYFSDVYKSWLAENKFDRSDDCTGSVVKGNSTRHWNKQTILEENRRNTYKQFHHLLCGQEPSVLNKFGERKLLTPVGLHSEYGYARSLARFAANLGPSFWRAASQKIERSLPPGVRYGPGWVDENDITPERQLILPSAPDQVSPHPFVGFQNSSSATRSWTCEPKRVELPEACEGNSSLEMQESSTVSATFLASSFSANKAPQPRIGNAEATEGSNNLIQRSFPQIHKVHPTMNGYNGICGSSLNGMGMLSGLNTRSSHMLETISRNNPNFMHSEGNRYSENSSSSSGTGFEAMTGQATGLHSMPSLHGFLLQPKLNATLIPQHQPESVQPPDMKVGLRTLGSPSSYQVDSGQPDLALQL